MLTETDGSINYFHLNHIAEMGFGILGIPKRLGNLIPQIETPINLGNMIALAKKMIDRAYDSGDVRDGFHVKDVVGNLSQRT